MRWIWIDRIIEMEPGRRCVAVKGISLAEDVLHDHFAAEGGLPALPVMPNTLIIEGMAQTAGILVGRQSDFTRNVILAKITHARFEAAATAGQALRFSATLDRFDNVGAATSGSVDVQDVGASNWHALGQIDLLFSHVDENSLHGLAQGSFVFTGPLLNLLKLGDLR